MKTNRRKLFKRSRLLAAGAAFVIVSVSAGCTALHDARDQTPWKFVSMPDFINFDVDYPNPNWDDTLHFVLQAVKNENPDFLIVGGDMVAGIWHYEDANHLRRMADRYYSAWIRRMQDHDLKFYVAVGDHELGDNWWRTDKKRRMFPHFEAAFRRHFQMPENGPPHMKGLAYSVRHKGTLFVMIDPFEQKQDGSVEVSVSSKQLEWVKQTLRDNTDVQHRIFVGHTPILPKFRARRSSEIQLPGGETTPLWHVMKENHVDLYLTGEVHDISIQHKDGILQVITGSTPVLVPDFSYTLVTVYPNRILLEIKRIETIIEEPDQTQMTDAIRRDLEAIEARHLPKKMEKREKWRYWLSKCVIRLSDESMKTGFVTEGSMEIDKADSRREFKNRAGVFQTRFTDLD